MVLTLVAELLARATLVSPGGPVDTETAAAGEVSLWGPGSVPVTLEGRRAVAEATIEDAAAHPAGR
jgi:hypothetical protein